MIENKNKCFECIFFENLIGYLCSLLNYIFVGFYMFTIYLRIFITTFYIKINKCKFQIIEILLMLFIY